MIEHDYKVGDLVSFCDKPAIITTTDGTFADILYLDEYITTVVLLDKVNYLGPGQTYLREAHTMARVYMLVERLSELTEEEQDGQHNKDSN
jgi:hypothetical protein|nr:MAG TPA: hypothetical protein [Caudoviricetes sp.]